MPPLPRRPLAFALASSLTSAAVAQAPEPFAPLPLCAGAQWTYAVTAADGSETRQVVTDEGPYTRPDARPGRDVVHRLRVETGSDPETGTETTFECWSVDPFGVHRHPCTDASRRGTIDVTAPPQRLLSVPLGGPATWPCGDGTATLVAADAAVSVPAGDFRAAHVRVDGPAPRELWFAAGTGVVRELLRDGDRTLVRELTAFAPGADTRRERLLQHLHEQLGAGRVPAYNNTPWIGWIDTAPEAMVLPGHVAVVKTGTWSACYYVDAAGIHAFDPQNSGTTAAAARAAFGTDTAQPREDLPLAALATVVARAWAERLHLGNVVRSDDVTLAPPRPVRQPQSAAARLASVEVRGGAPDGTDRRVAVWITADRQSDLRLATDADDPWLPR